MPDLANNAEAIFMAALDQFPGERAAFLNAQCGGDALLASRVRELLQAHDQSQGPFDGPPPGLAHTVEQAASQEQPGTRIGPYKLLEQIGEGGFGVVFMAEQTQPVRRRVAVKVLKPGMDTRQVVARFEAERQALALMDHPNIAKVFDGGETTTGRPYFVMELVRGIPITEFCDQNRMPVRERVRLFVAVCHAVQHAHQKGIIHRDLKPSNIMVTLHDGTPVPKVIDFGIAKALGQQLTDKTLFTNFAQMIGTPIYMSPEQAEMSGLDMDTRSDIYSLGVLLYELLTGTTPCDKDRLKTATFDDIRRMIREEEPARPSTRLTTLGDAATIVSANRKTDPRQLCQQVRGDLDWVVMKALEKDRNRRYESVSAFAADVKRFLNDEQVLACPPSLSYRVRRAIRRQRGPLTVAALVLLSLIGGIVGTTWGLIRATGAYKKAIEETGLKETALKDKEAALKDKEAALKDAENQLFRALVSQANAEFRSGRIGQRFETLKAIRQAAKIRTTPELRTLATAALILPDAELDYEWDATSDLGRRDQVGFKDDFELYARIGKTGQLMICRRQNRQEEILHRLPAHGTPPYSIVRLSRDGRFVAYGHSSVQPGVCTSVRVWKLGPEPEVLALQEAVDLHMYALAFNPRSDQLAIGHSDKSISLFDLATGRRLHVLALDASAGMLSYHPRDSRLAVGTLNGVYLFDTKTGQRLPGPPQRGAVWAAWHPDGRRLAYASEDRKVYLWDVEEGVETMPGWTGHTSDGITVAFNQAGDRLLSNDWSNRVRLWDVATGRLLLAMPGSFGDRFSLDDQLIGPGGKDGRFEIHRVASGREFRVLRRRQAHESLENLTAPVIAADGRTLAACATNWLTFFDLASGEELGSIRQPRPCALTPVHFDVARKGQSGGWLTAGSSGLFRWPVQTDGGRPDVLLVGPPEELAKGLGHAFSRGASASADGNVVALPRGNITTVLHRDQPERRLVLGPQNDVRFCAVSPNGRWVFAGGHWADGRSKNARVWDAHTGKQITELPVEASTPGKFSPDGRWLVTMGDSGCRLWEVSSWREVRHFKATHAAFSPDSRLLAVNDLFGVIRLVETATGREVARLTGPESHWYIPTGFTPDGAKLVASWSGETALCVWDLRLIRQQLKEMGLDWEWDEFAPAEPMPRIRRVEIDGGEFAGAGKN